MLTQKPKSKDILEGALEKIPNEVFTHEIGKFLELKTLNNLSQTSKNVSTLFQEPFEDLVHREFLQAVVDDNQEKVKKILRAKPELLLKAPKKNQAIESQLTWQKFCAEEPLKMALKRNQLEMVKLILPYFDNIKDINGKEEALKQWKACEVSEKVKKEREQQYTDKMKKLIEQIAKEDFPKGTEKDRIIARISDKTKETLEAFRIELLPNTPIKLDTYFDLEALLYAAYKAYDDNFDNFQNWNQRNLYCIAVIGFIQSVLPPELAKIFCEGLYDVVENKKPISREAAAFKLTNDYGFSIYRSKSDTPSVVESGFDFFVGSAARASGLLQHCDSPGGLVCWVLKNYVEQKQSSLASLKENLMQDVCLNRNQPSNVLV